jgi:hypothetical protein
MSGNDIFNDPPSPHTGAASADAPRAAQVDDADVPQVEQVDEADEADADMSYVSGNLAVLPENDSPDRESELPQTSTENENEAPTREADAQPRGESTVRADAKAPEPDVEPVYLDEDGLPTVLLAKALAPLFVKNYILKSLPSQVNANYCSVFIAKSKRMFMARDLTFKYLCQFAVCAGLLPQKIEYGPILYNRLAKNWVELNYLFERNNEEDSTSYQKICLYDTEQSKWIITTITFEKSYQINYEQISRDVSLETIPELYTVAGKTFETLVHDIHKARYLSSDNVL